MRCLGGGGESSGWVTWTRTERYWVQLGALLNPSGCCFPYLQSGVAEVGEERLARMFGGSSGYLQGTGSLKSSTLVFLCSLAS